MLSSPESLSLLPSLYRERSDKAEKARQAEAHGQTPYIYSLSYSDVSKDALRFFVVADSKRLRLFFLFLICRFRYGKSRAISTARLSGSLRVHLRPIYVVVFNGPFIEILSWSRLRA